MRKLGMIGGMSWVSTRSYYERINRHIVRERGSMASAPLLIESLDFTALHGIVDADDWSRAETVLVASARRLVDAGAEGLLIAANSMHKVYEAVNAAAGVPMFHIADCVGEAMKEAGATDAAILGTRNVMTEDFYRQRLEAHGVELLPPNLENVETLNRLIYGDLMAGRATRDGERQLKSIITRLGQDGARAIILACTELDQVVDVDANVLPIFDSSRIHCHAAAEWILAGG